MKHARAIKFDYVKILAILSVKRIKELLLYSYVVFKAANVVISRCCFEEDGTELF